MLKEVSSALERGNPPNSAAVIQLLTTVAQRLAAVEEKVAGICQITEMLQQIKESLAQPSQRQEAYSPVEIAKILGKKPYTVREWCRLKRINARKRPYGRGDADEWEISHEELERIKAHGLLPIPTKY